jgi:cell division protein FtsI (penicillin-binding protein 3)
MDNKKKILMKRTIIYWLMFIPCLIILGRILYIQIHNHDTALKEFERIYYKKEIIPEKRGNIYSWDSENNEFLIFATYKLRYEIRIDLGDNLDKKWDSIFKKDISGLSDSLSQLFKDKSKKEYLKDLQQARKEKKYNVLIAKEATPAQVERMKTFPFLKPCWDLPSITKREYYKRFYPYEDMWKMARRTIGILQNEIRLYDGIEGQYDSLLLRPAESIFSRKVYASLVDKQFINKEPCDIVTTIDVSLQELADYSLEKCLMENNAKSGCVVLMEVKTGHIKAISNLEFDSSIMQYRELRNIALTDRMESGSTFKTITSMLMLDKGLAKITDTVPKGYRFYPNTKKAIEDDNSKLGQFTFSEALEYSSNVGISYLVYENYVKKGKQSLFIKDIKQYFRFDSVLNLDYKFIFKKNNIPYVGTEPLPVITARGSSVDDVLRLSYGYVSMITPLQMLTFYNAIANNGIMVKPMFVSHILKNKNGAVDTITVKPSILKAKICNEQTLATLQDVLKRVVEHGTAKLSRTSYGVAGKTGTAEINRDKSRNRASFVGYFPADEPLYSCIVVISEAKSPRQHGGELAAPTFKTLSDRAMARKSIKMKKK